MAFSPRYLQFLASENREERYLAHYQPVTSEGVAADIYQSTDGFGSKLTDAIAAKEFEAGMLGGFSFISSVPIDNLYGIIPGADGGFVEHLNSHGRLDSWRTGYFFDGRAATLYHGGWSEATGELEFSEYARVFDGEVQNQPAVGLTTNKVRLKPIDQRFDFPFTETVHCGLPWHWHGNGTSDYVDFGTSASFNFTSFPFGIRLRWLPNVIPVADKVLVSRGSSSGGGTDGYQVRQLTNGKIAALTFQSGATQTTTSTAALVAGRRYTIDIEFDSTGNCFLYIDGVLDIQGTIHVAPASSTRHLYVLQNDAGTQWANGFINELALFNATRFAAVVSDTAHRTLTAAERLESRLVGYWPFDDGSATTVFERSGQGSNGTTHGGNWYRALEGAADHQGERHPQAWGPTRNVTAVQVEINPPIWQLHAARMATGTIVREGGMARTLGNSGVEFTDWTSFLAATTTGNHFDILRTAGGTFARLAIPAQLGVTFDVPGDDTDGTHRTTAVAIARHFMTNFGPYPLDDATELDTTAWDDADASHTAVHGLWWSGDETIRDVCDAFLQSAGFSALRSTTTRLFTLERFEGVASAVAKAISNGESIPVITEEMVDLSSVDPQEARAPVWITRLKCARNYTPMGTADLSAALNAPNHIYDDLRRFLMQEWRTGNGPNMSPRLRRRQARELLINGSTFYEQADGRAEAQRRTAIWAGREQAITLRVLNYAGQFDLFKPVYLRIELEDEDGAPLNRLGTGDDQAFVIFALNPDPSSGTVLMTLYREDS